MKKIQTKVCTYLSRKGIVGFAHNEGKEFILRAIIIGIAAAITFGLLVKTIQERNEYGYPTTKRVISSSNK